MSNYELTAETQQYYVLTTGRGYFTADIEDIMTKTGEWDWGRWHEELDMIADSEVLHAYGRLCAYNYNPYPIDGVKNDIASGEVLTRAIRAIESHLHEQMNPKNWGDKWWMQ